MKTENVTNPIEGCQVTTDLESDSERRMIRPKLQYRRTMFPGSESFQTNPCKCLNSTNV